MTQQILQTVIAALVLGIIGGLWTMYNIVQGHSAKILDIQTDIAEQKGKLDVYDTRLRAVENITIRIDENVKELLRVQTRESPGRIADRR